MDVESQMQVEETARRFGVPPAILSALVDHPGGIDVPGSVAKAYGFDGVVDQPVKVALAARVLSDAFAKHNDWESALSVYRGHDPHTWQTHDHVGGFVDSVLGLAATRQHGPGDQAFQKTQQRLSQQGGVVEPPTQPTGPKPLEPGEDPHAIAAFAQEARALGLDPQMIASDFPHAAVLRQRLLSQPTGLEDFAKVQGMDPGAMLDYYRNHPHPVYPEVTAGAFHDMKTVSYTHLTLPTICSV